MTEERYLELVDDAIERPHDPDLLAELDVVGDWLQSIGDPRGTVIALSRAIDRAPSRRRAWAAERALADYLLADGIALARGCEHALRQGWLRGVWCGGYLCELRLDARYLAGRRQAQDDGFRAAFDRILRAPLCARGLRRIDVRVRTEPQYLAVLEPVERGHPALADSLEVCLVGMGEDVRDIYPETTTSRPWPNTPRLHTLVGWNNAAIIAVAQDLRARTRLGRRLWDPTTRLAALGELLHRREHALVPVLELLLAPRLLPEEEQLEVLRVLSKLGASARIALPRLHFVARSAQRYREAVRSRAGRCIDQIRGAA